ncbi:MAG: hypothetical protein GX750_00140 [Clostridia bacterium]|nr:hypothetical protein [Clostridia bacterium]
MTNHLRQALRNTGEQRIYAVVGGTHLFNASADRLERTVAELKKPDLKK